MKGSVKSLLEIQAIVVCSSWKMVTKEHLESRL